MPTSGDVLAGDLIRIHKVITRGLEIADTRFDEEMTGAGDSGDQGAGFQLFAKCLFSFMINHHEGEDTIGFPYLKKNVEGLDVEQLIEDHKLMHPLIVKGLNILETGNAREPDSGLREVVTNLREKWLKHIGEEEDCFGCELITKCLSVESAEDLGKQFSAHGREGSKPASLMLPFVYYSLDGADREIIGSEVPGFVRKLLVPILWKKAWKPMAPFLLPQ